MAEMDMPVAGAQAPADNKQMVNAIIASVLGWALDLFDLFILLYVAPVVGALFFPSSNAALSLAAVYGSFAVTLLMRPLGSAVFGHYADVHGRKQAMLIAIVGVGISTAAFGLLPTIAQVGVIAPIIFLLLRLGAGHIRRRRRGPPPTRSAPSRCRRIGAARCRAWSAAAVPASARCWPPSSS